MDQKWKDYLINGGLYESLKINEQNIGEIVDLFTSEYSLDAYCLECKEQSVFRRVQQPWDHEIGLLAIQNPPAPGFIPTTEQEKAREMTTLNRLCNMVNDNYLQFVCTRDGKTALRFYFRLTPNGIIKIGQYPTPMDISTVIPTKYSKILEDHYLEYKRSIELHTYGYFIGAYVYLRRIIELILLRAHERARSGTTWDEEQYKKSRFAEKADMLRSELPDFFIENITMYGLVSKGIHELSEKECQDMYPIR